MYNAFSLNEYHIMFCIFFPFSACAKVFTDEGAKVILCSRNLAALDKVKQDILAANAKVCSLSWYKASCKFNFRTPSISTNFFLNEVSKPR